MLVCRCFCTPTDHLQTVKNVAVLLCLRKGADTLSINNSAGKHWTQEYSVGYK
jgi:hypothetical protein